jgi:Leucine-rich repeat (LRR) protein
VNVESEADSDDFQEEPLPCSSQQTEVDLSQLYLTSFPLTDFFGSTARYVAAQIVELNLSNNQFMQLPSAISQFINLQSLDLSNNQFVNLSEELSSLTKLRSLAARNNLLEDLPKSLQFLQRLESVNLSGNSFESIPPALFEMTSLKSVHFGANMIDHLPSQIGQLRRLEVLYLSGNRLVEVPAAIGRLRNLTSLALADNRLETIPPTFAELQSLQSLSLHNNQLKTLPTGIARLRNLEQLSLRNNPLVTKFVNDISFDPPSLKELAARIVKINVPSEEVRSTMLPREVNTYLRSANQPALSISNSSISAESIAYPYSNICARQSAVRQRQRMRSRIIPRSRKKSYSLCLNTLHRIE